MRHVLYVFLFLLLIAATPARAGFEDGERALWRNDFSRALKEFKPLAEEGHPRAQTYMGWLYLRGQAVERDVEKAIKWLEKAADQYDVAALNLLSTIHERGAGIPRSRTIALYYSRQAAALGDPSAMGSLAFHHEGRARKNKEHLVDAYKWWTLVIHRVPDPVRLDYVINKRDLLRDQMTVEQVKAAEAAAREWKPKRKPFRTKSDATLGLTNVKREKREEALAQLQAAYGKDVTQAEAGDVEAQYRVGRARMTGLGVRRDFAQAAEWLKKAADKDHMKALTALGSLYRSGLGVPYDINKAITLYTRAAEKGSGLSQWRLGVIRLYGQGGTKPDVAEAYYWLSLAKRFNTRSNIKQTVRALSQFAAERLSEEQVDAITKKAAAFSPGK